MVSSPPAVAIGLDAGGRDVVSSEAVSQPVLPPPTEPSSEQARTLSSSRSPGLPATPSAPCPRKLSLAERRAGTHGPLPQIEVVHPAVFDVDPRQQQWRLQISPKVPPWILPEHSTPIAIPLRPKNNTSRPTTPLTARGESSGHYFPFDDITPKKPQISQSLRPSYQHHKKAQPDRSSNLDLTPSRKQYMSRSAATISTHPRTPSSPLSPTMPTAPYSSTSQGDSRRTPPQNLQIPSLPRFHPANYQSSRFTSANTPNTTRPPSRDCPPRSPRVQHRQFSDAQQKVHQYQREVIANATRMSSVVSPVSAKVKKPVTPLLLPCGSPGTGPATPMTLADTGDYMLAGLDRSQSGFGDKDLVDRLIHEEHDRISGMHSGRSSPAISPAGGRC